MLVGAALLVGCGPSLSEATAAPVAPPETAEQLERALRRAGATARLQEGSPEQVEGAAGKSLTLGDEHLYVYEIEPGIPVEEVLGALLAAQPGAQPRVWVQGPLVVSYAGEDGGTFLLLSGLLGDPIRSQGAQAEGPYPPAVLAAIRAVAERASAPPVRVRVLSFEPRTWSDACFGWGEAGAPCPAAEVSGWQIRLQVDDRIYEARTDEMGSTVKIR
jgi:hypothetical protein